ncbi:MAG: DUF3224 domain-containing protein [Myxococcota bacterium]
MKAHASFKIDRWEETDKRDAPGARFVSTVVDKTFEGDLEGQSAACLTMAHGPSDLRAYCGYEHITGVLFGRKGGFILLHDAIAGPDQAPQAHWRILEGSGTGEWTGIAGSATITPREGQDHAFDLEFTWPE